LCIGEIMKRTNLELDEKLVQKGMKLTGIKTYKELVNFSLSELVRKGKQREFLKHFGKIKWKGDLKKLREMG